MKRIALYGYGKFGKRTAESFRFFWGDEYRVTAVFDKDGQYKKDRFWDLPVQSPSRIKPEYEKGTFDAVMVCIFTKKVRNEVAEYLTDMGIPVFVPGDVRDFADYKAFDEDTDPGITVSREKYSFHVYKNMLGAVADCERYQIFFLFNEEGRVNIDNYRKYIEDYESHMLLYPFRLRDPLPERIYLSGDYCAITKPYSVNYWHFTFEAADCVYLLEKAGFTGKYIYNERIFSRELLQIMGISPERIIATKELDLHKVYVFERLFHINHEGLQHMECSKDVLPEMAESIKKKLKINKDAPKKLFIKRLGIRKMLNGEDIAVKNGFRVITPEEYSVKEQMELFYNADIVISPHGANCTNYLYMHKGAVFAETFSDRWHMDINAGVCEACGVRYLQMKGKAITGSGADGQYADFTVDEEEFIQLIRKAEQTAYGNGETANGLL